MSDVASNLKDWSTTAASNNPTDSTTISSGLADNFQQLQATVRQDLASKGADIASASTTDLGAVPGLFHDITGTTTITSFGTVAAGIWKVIKFEGALTLTHSASLILPTSANITTANGDTAIVSSEGAGVWRCHSYMRVSGQPIATAVSVASLATSGNVTVGGTFAASGNANVTGTLAANGNATVAGTLAVTGNTTLSGTLGVTGTASLANMTASGNATVSGSMIVSSLTSGRIPYATTSGRLIDSAALTTAFAADTNRISVSGSGTNFNYINVVNTDVAGGESYMQVDAYGGASFLSSSQNGIAAVFMETANSGDPYISYTASSASDNTRWAHGIDNSVAGDPFVLSASDTLGTSNVLSVTTAGAATLTGNMTVLGATAIPAGGTAGAGYRFSSTSNFGIFFGSGAPTLSAAKGSLYLRSDGSATNNRAYINTNGGTTWTALTTAA